MRDQEIVDLMEAYSSIYSSQKGLVEEVEIASQYFYEMGLNENGVDILIEDLGIEEFAEFVYDIAKEHVLVEARAGGVRIEPKTKAGKSVGQLKGGAKTAAINRLRKQKEARKSAEASASASEPSGMKASLQRQSAIANARKNQSNSGGTQKSIAGRIGAALGSAVNRAKKDIELTKQTAQTVGKAAKVGIEAMNRASDTRLARQARVATHKGVKRHTQALRAAGSSLGKTLGASAARRSSQREEVELWVNSLIEEGYDLSEYTWDDMYEIYMEEVEQVDENRMAAYTAGMSDGARASAGTQVGSRVADSMSRSSAKFFFGRRKQGGQAGYSPNPSSPATRNRTGRGTPVQYRKGPLEMPKGNSSFRNFSSTHKEEVDLFDYILEHLVAEGYADTNKAALAIMANMSEDWKQSIVEQSAIGARAAKVVDDQRQGYHGDSDAINKLQDAASRSMGRLKKGQGPVVTPGLPGV